MLTPNSDLPSYTEIEIRQTTLLFSHQNDFVAQSGKSLNCVYNKAKYEELYRSVISKISISLIPPAFLSFAFSCSLPLLCLHLFVLQIMFFCEPLNPLEKRGKGWNIGFLLLMGRIKKGHQKMAFVIVTGASWKFLLVPTYPFLFFNQGWIWLWAAQWYSNKQCCLSARRAVGLISGWSLPSPCTCVGSLASLVPRHAE